MRGSEALDIRLHRKNMEVPPALLETAERKLAKLESFVDSSGWVELGFVEEQNPRIADKYHCEIVTHLKGHRLKVEGAAGDAFGALDQAVAKAEKQLRRLKEKRIKRRQRGAGNGGNATPPGPLTLDGEPRVSDVDRGPVIVEVAQAAAKPMTPVEAALQLDLNGQEFLLFHNAENDRAAVIYRRAGGDYGLVEAAG